MFKKCLSVVLALIILLSVLAVSPVSVTAQVVDTIDEGANLELASTGNPYGKWQDTEYPDGDGYYEIRCTWFAWQKAYDVCGVELPAWGNGNSWYASAQAANIPTGTVPRVNSIACFNSGYYGHVSFVTAVHDDNTMTVEEGGRTDLDHTASQGVGTSRPSSVVGVGGLQGFIYLGNSDTHYGAEIVNFDGANASNVSFFDATIGCWMRNPNSYNIRSYGFYLGNNQNELVQYTIGQNVKWTDSYIQANLSDYVGRLSQGVTYYYRFFSLTDGYNLSPVYSFSTAGNSTVTFDNVVSSYIDNDNMSIECWVRNHQGLNINKYGLYYGTSVNGMNECIEVGSNVSWTDFHISIKIIDQNIELKPNTTYYYQFFALTDGWNFSNVSSFTTGDYIPRNDPTTPTVPPTFPTEPLIIRLGDADGDGVVTVIDATTIQKKLASISVPIYIEVAADVDGDKVVTVLDATYIQKHLAHMDIPFEIGKIKE